MTRHLAIVTVLASALLATAQSVSDITPFRFSVPPLQPDFEWPVTPGHSASPMPFAPSNIAPTMPELHIPYPGKLTGLADSLVNFPSATRTTRMPMAEGISVNLGHVTQWYDSRQNGVITLMGEGYLGGYSSRQAFPAMGNTASAGIYITQPVGESLTVTAGLEGSKYHFDRSAWNDFGFWGSASYRINETLSLKAFGQYYVNPTYHSMASMAMTQSTGYGAALGIKVSDNVSVDVGAQRYYDAFSGKWRTVPIVAPTVKVWGQPVSIDFGGLIYDMLKSLINDYHAKKVTEAPGPMPIGHPRQRH